MMGASAATLAQLPGTSPPPAPRGLPSLGDAGAMTALEERKLGDAIIRELYRDPDYIDDPIVGEYVDVIWRRLLAGARARGELPAELDERYAWTVLLGRDRTINAFALPGGYFGLHLGLVGVVSSRDELASVLAHEMSHITQRHIPRLLGQQSRQAPWMIAAMVLGAIAASKNPQAGAALAVGGQAAVIQQQLNFSRDMEREADRIGYGIMTQAGYAPQGFVGMFEKLQAASRINDNGDWPYLRSHPLTTQRIADMQQRQQGLVRPDAPAAPRAPAASAPTPGASPELPETVVRANRPAPAPDGCGGRGRRVSRPGHALRSFLGCRTPWIEVALGLASYNRRGAVWLAGCGGRPRRSPGPPGLNSLPPMPAITDYPAFVIAILLFLAIPGPGNLAIISSTAQGRVPGGLAQAYLLAEDFLAGAPSAIPTWNASPRCSATGAISAASTSSSSQ